VNKGKVVHKRLIEAEVSLSEAELLREEKVSNIATVTRLYQSVIYGLFALFELDNIGTLTHAELIDRFENDFVERGIFKMDYLEAMRFAYNFTPECDYANMRQPVEGDINYLFPLVEEFVASVTEYTKTGQFWLKVAESHEFSKDR